MEARSPAAPPAAARIYVVDDELMVAEVLQAILRLAGFETRVFQDPLLALHTLTEAKVRPLLLVTDFAMGPVNGQELIQACKMVAPGLKTMLIGGGLAPEAWESAGIRPDRVLGKPFQPEMLLQAVREVLALSP